MLAGQSVLKDQQGRPGFWIFCENGESLNDFEKSDENRGSSLGKPCG